MVQFSRSCTCTCIQGFSGPLSQKSDENPRMRVIPHSKFPPKMRACADSRRFFVTTDLKIPVHTGVATKTLQACVGHFEKFSHLWNIRNPWPRLPVYSSPPATRLTHQNNYHCHLSLTWDSPHTHFHQAVVRTGDVRI